MTPDERHLELINLRMELCDIMRKYGHLPENVIHYMMQSVLHESAAINLTMSAKDADLIAP